MGKNVKRLYFLFICFIFLLLFIDIKGVRAQSSTAKAKGFTTTGMTYLGDEDITDCKIYGSEFYYGKVSMWAAVYKCIVTEDDGSNSCYYAIFIESSIESRGKTRIGLINNYFRNKYLTINVELLTYDSEETICVDYTKSSSATTSETNTYNIGGAIGADSDGPNAEISAGFSVSYTQSYDTVNLSCTKSREGITNAFTFQYYFTKWKGGSMISPNKGLVTERMYLLYQIENYNGNDNFSLNISTKATIYKDVAGGIDSTVSKTIELSGINGKLEEI